MYVDILKIVVVLLVAGSGDARPQKIGGQESQAVGSNDEEWKPIAPSVRGDSRAAPVETRSSTNDLQYMDQSLRTVATQLLNVTNPEDVPQVSVGTVLMTAQKTSSGKVNASTIGQIADQTSVPLATKFTHLESSHPGQAMAITEEELEREMGATRLMTAHKTRPTTTGGISTWILLNPPSTTVKTVVEKEKVSQKSEEKVGTVEMVAVKTTEASTKEETTAKRKEQKVDSEKPQPTTVSIEKTTGSTTKKPTTTVMKKTTEASEKNSRVSEKPEVRSTTVKTRRTTEGKDEFSSTTVSSVSKKVQTDRTTAKPKTANPTKAPQTKSTTASVKKQNQQVVKPTGKPGTQTRRTTSKIDVTATSKIEKVTFKPVQTITSPKIKSENTERPMFVTKIKASVLTDAQKTSTTEKPSLSATDFVQVSVKSKPLTAESAENLKKTEEEGSSIEVEAIEVNPPVLKIEKVQETTSSSASEENVIETTKTVTKSDSDLSTKFEPATEGSDSSTTVSTTTKRPRNSNKRKKNKQRRRKPSSTTVASSTTSMTTTTPAPTTILALDEENEVSVIPTIVDNDVQESKDDPESKIAPNSTKTKKKPVQKPIGTQIYNYLSREVMPSLGVMSLVGFGIGLASYLLYPFGGPAPITRRNYEVEPHYKYDPEEYGGNYGQSEEEVLAKVFQGMTKPDGKYKDNNGDYYRYQHFEGVYEPLTTRRTEQRFSSVSSPPGRPVTGRRPLDNVGGTVRTTPTYYDRRVNPEYTTTHDGQGIRQFVVGNVPKEYPVFQKGPTLTTLSSVKSGYESTIGGLGYDRNQANSRPEYGVEGQTEERPDDGYEEIEITPTAVAVEHGPRALKVKRSIVEDWSRAKRESVIQVIPSRREIEEEQKEESLSNEILDIIDHALVPETGETKFGSRKEDNEVEDLEAQRRKQREEEKTRAKGAAKGAKVVTNPATTTTPMTTRSYDRNNEIPHNDDAHEIGNDDTSEEKSTLSPSTISSESSTSSKAEESATLSSTATAEETTDDWFDDVSTAKPDDTATSSGFGLFDFVKKVAEIKFRLGLTILKHASEGFARYLGHVQKRINGEE